MLMVFCIDVDRKVNKHSRRDKWGYWCLARKLLRGKCPSSILASPFHSHLVSLRRRSPQKVGTSLSPEHDRSQPQLARLHELCSHTSLDVLENTFLGRLNTLCSPTFSSSYKRSLLIQLYPQAMWRPLLVRNRRILVT